MAAALLLVHGLKQLALPSNSCGILHSSSHALPDRPVWAEGSKRKNTSFCTSSHLLCGGGGGGGGTRIALS